MKRLIMTVVLLGLAAGRADALGFTEIGDAGAFPPGQAVIGFLI